MVQIQITIDLPSSALKSGDARVNIMTLHTPKAEENEREFAAILRPAIDQLVAEVAKRVFKLRQSPVVTEEDV